MMYLRWMSLTALIRVALATAALAAEPAARPSLWVDLFRGEPIAYEDVLDDLADSDVIYLGERHTLERHHTLQETMVADLARRGGRLVIGLEQIEAVQQPIVDQFNRGQLSFEQLAEALGWAKRWSNYAQYKPLLDAARKAGAPVVALNAPSEVVRQIARGGLDKLEPAKRALLPSELTLEDPIYEKLLQMELMVHMAATAERLRPMVHAQIVRDETMAASLCAFLQTPEGKGRKAIVVCGAGHVAYGLGMPARVRRRIPGVTDRIVQMSESGDVELTAQERAMARPITITHQQLKDLGRPVADYVHVTGLRGKEAKPGRSQ